MSNISDKLHHTFRARRIQLGKTQGQLESETGLSRKTISDFERGMGAISLRNLHRLLLAVGLELSTREGWHPPIFDELAEVYAEEPDSPRRAKRVRRKR